MLGAVYLLMFHAALTVWMFSRLHMNDFGKFYYATVAYRSGGDLYTPSVATAIPIGSGLEHQFLNLNPPHFHLAMIPFSFLPPTWALGLWTAAGVSALATSIRSASASITRRQLSLQEALWVTLAALALAPTAMVSLTGQVTYFLTLLVTNAWAAARTGRWRRAGALMGLAVATKPFLAPLCVYLAVRRRWAALATAAVSAVLCYGAGLAVFGWAAHVHWVRALASVDWEWAPMNGSIAGMLSRALESSPLFVPVLLRPDWVAPLSMVFSSAVFTATVWRCVRSSHDVDLDFARFLSAALLISPLGWAYYLPLTAAPLAAVWWRRWAGPWTLADYTLVAGTMLSFTPVVVSMAATDTAVGTLSVGSVSFWTTSLLWAGSMAANGAPDASHTHPASTHQELDPRIASI